MNQHDKVMEARAAVLETVRAFRTPVTEDEVYAYHKAVAADANRAAVRLGLPRRVSTIDVARLERPALGHSDYGSKFALYVAEALVMGAS